MAIQTYIHITHDPITLSEAHAAFSTPSHCGAAIWFDGIVRNYNEGQDVTGIEYTYYPGMAEKEVQRIIDEVRKQWPIADIYFAHRVGQLVVGDTSLIVGMASPHRPESFAACEYLIKELKKRVPIWKKESYETAPTQWLCA